MNVEQRTPLLQAMSRLDYREAENAERLARVFLPLPAHSLALRQDVVIVRGGRGAGKSALFKLLKDLRTTEEIRKFFNDSRLPEATWIDAFAQSPNHPQDTSLDGFAQGADEDTLRAFWMSHLLFRLKEELPHVVEAPAELYTFWVEHRSDPARWVPAAQAQLGTVASALDRVERELQKTERLVFATYDHLDRLGTFMPLIRRRYVASLLALWLSLSNRYQHLRPKIFLREDLLDAGELGFPDASKLRSRSVSIDWDVESLYRVTVRHMADWAPLRAWLEDMKGGPSLRQLTGRGFMPGPMPEALQKAFAKQLAGDVMGKGAKKGYTYRWIPGHLQDAQAKVVPRSFLVLLGQAAKEALKHPLGTGQRLITPQDLIAALAETSRQRVGEIQEEYKLVNRLRHLEGAILLLSQEEVIELVARPVEGEPAGLSTNGRAVFEELVRLGVLAVRSNGRVDVPDIYRFGFGIKRKGGVARPR